MLMVSHADRKFVGGHACMQKISFSSYFNGYINYIKYNTVLYINFIKKLKAPRFSVKFFWGFVRYFCCGKRSNQLAFLDVLVLRRADGSMDHRVYRLSLIHI